MQNIIEVTVTVRLNGQDIVGSPYTYRQTVGELDTVAIQKADGDGSTYYSLSRLTTVNGILITTDQNLNFGFMNQATGLQLGPGGLILILGAANMTLGVNDNWTVNNDFSEAANIQGFEFGP